jgi:hypothetical protein
MARAKIEGLHLVMSHFHDDKYLLLYSGLHSLFFPFQLLNQGKVNVFPYAAPSTTDCLIRVGAWLTVQSKDALEA